MIYLGIDPGLGGAVAMLLPKGGLDVFRMPTRPRSLYKGKRCDWSALGFRLRRRWLVGGEDLVVIEAQHSIRGDGVASAFTFGGAYEGWIALIESLRVPYEEVKPQTWQQSFGIHRAKGEPRKILKQRAKAIADSLFPEAQGITQQTADAVLLAEYARRLRH